MISERTTGIILRVRPLTETSLIIHWLTPDLGRLATVAKGARRAKSPFRGKVDLFYLADFSFLRSRRSELHTLGEVGLLETHAALRRELAYLRQASYSAALIEQTTETETPLRGVFDLFNSFLVCLSSGSPQPRTVFAFELKLLRELGLAPDLEKTKLSPVGKELVKHLGEGDWSDIAALKPARGEILELRQFLHGFLIFHLGKLPPGRSDSLKLS